MVRVSSFNSFHGMSHYLNFQCLVGLFDVQDIWPNILVDEVKRSLFRALAWELGNDIDNTRFVTTTVSGLTHCLYQMYLLAHLSICL